MYLILRARWVFTLANKHCSVSIHFLKRSSVPGGFLSKAVFIYDLKTVINLLKKSEYFSVSEKYGHIGLDFKDIVFSGFIFSCKMSCYYWINIAFFLGFVNVCSGKTF